MIMGRFSTRAVLLASTVVLLTVIVGGGVVLGWVEEVAPTAGIWMAFNVVTTTGFGSGPVTSLGRVLSMGLFATAALSWFGFLLTVIEVANLRFQRRALIDEALRPLARRPGSRLFHVN